MKDHKFEFPSIGRIISNGKQTVNAAKIANERAGDGHATANTFFTHIEDLIRNIRSLDSSSIRSHKGKSKKSLISLWEKDRRIAIDMLWSMYGVLQMYDRLGKFSEGGERKAFNIGYIDMDHIIHSHKESGGCGVFYRPKEAHKKPTTEGPLASVKGMECATDGPRAESRWLFKLYSRINEVVGGRTVMPLKATKAHLESLEFEVYEVKLTGKTPEGEDIMHTVRKAIY